MSTVYLKVTRRCNMRCEHCFIQHYQGDMSLAVIANVAKAFPSSTVIFHGGEPTLMGMEYIRKCIELLGSRPYVLQSNMIEMHDGWFSLLKEHFDGRIGTSLDVARFSYLDCWLSNVQMAADHGIAVTAVVTITPQLTIGALSGALERFEEVGGTAFRMQVVTPIKTPAVSKEQYMEFLKAFYDHPLNENRQRLGSALCFGLQNGINGGNCGKSLRTIEPDGTVYVCPDLAGQSLFPLGNVLHEDLRSIRLDRMFFERERRLALECDEDCWRICRGGCLAAAHFQSKNPMERDPYCAAYKNILEFVRQKGGLAVA